MIFNLMTFILFLTLPYRYSIMGKIIKKSYLLQEKPNLIYLFIYLNLKWHFLSF